GEPLQPVVAHDRRGAALRALGQGRGHGRAEARASRDGREAPARPGRPAELPARLLRAHQEGRVRGRRDVGPRGQGAAALRGLHLGAALRGRARRVSQPPSGAEAPPLFTARFFTMCGFTFTVFLSLFQLLPTAPFRILDLGGSKAIAGLFLGALTYASALSAP